MRGALGERSALFSQIFRAPAVSVMRAPARSALECTPSRSEAESFARWRDTAASLVAQHGTPIPVMGYHTSFHDPSVYGGRISQIRCVANRPLCISL